MAESPRPGEDRHARFATYSAVLPGSINAMITTAVETSGDVIDAGGSFTHGRLAARDALVELLGEEQMPLVSNVLNYMDLWLGPDQPVLDRFSPNVLVRMLRAAASPVRSEWRSMNVSDMPAVFGTGMRPLGVEPFETLHDRATLPDPDDLRRAVDRIARFSAVTDAGGRWPLDRRVDRPRVAGDAVALLARYGADAAERASLCSWEAVDAPDGPDGDGEALVHTSESWKTMAAGFYEASAAIGLAEPYYIPHGFSAAIAESSPLDAEDLDAVRLPYPIVFASFGDPIMVGGDVADRRLPDREDIFEWMVDVDRRLAAFDDEINGFKALIDHPQAPLAPTLFTRGATVDALVLYADSDGRLRDEFVWCISIPTEDETRVLARITLPARRSLTGFRTLVDNTAALVAWGDWEEPDEFDLPDDTESREWRKATNRGAFRRAEPRGAPGRVRVLDVRRTVSRADAGDATATGRTVAPHTRRGHWRRVRTGTRADWETHRSTKRVWVPPTWVNAHLGENPEPRVYRVRPDQG